MPAFFSSEGSFLLQFLVIFAAIAMVMLVAYLLYTRLAGRGLSLSARAGNRARQPRLGIVDIYELDRQRQLILLRRDNVEHLLLVGGPNDVVVERNVQRGHPGRLPGDGLARVEPALGAPAEPAAEEPARLPSFEMPVVVSPPLPGSAPHAEGRVPPLDPALFEPRVREPPLDPAARPEPAAEPAAEPGAGHPVERSADDVAHGDAHPAPVPPVLSTSEPRTVDPAILSDMARQLEVALRRPSSAVTPPPGPAGRAVADDVGRDHPAAKPPVDTVAAGMAASQVLSIAPTEAPAAPVAREHAADAPTEAVAAPFKPAPAPTGRNTGAGASTGTTDDRAKPQPAPNPFSVEEIEAEFARLLGRPLDKG